MVEFNFNEEDQKERCTVFIVACKSIVADLNERSEDKFQVGYDIAVVYDVFESVYHDIGRYKKAHQNEPEKQKSNSIKRAAYYTKWILKLRPIWVSRPEGYLAQRYDYSLLLNERFAIEWALANISFELGAFCPTPTENKFYELLYDLHYRRMTADSLIHLYQMYYDLARNEPIFVDLDRV